MVKLEFRHELDTWSVDVTSDGETLRVSCGAGDFVLAAAPGRDGAWWVDTPAGRRRLWVAVRGDERLVFSDGKVWHLRLPDPEHEDEPEAAADRPLLSARMPGKVIRVLVAETDAVTAGQPLLIMESMKMETELTASVDGVVSRIMVVEGQVVAQDDPLVAIEPHAD